MQKIHPGFRMNDRVSINRVQGGEEAVRGEGAYLLGYSTPLLSTRCRADMPVKCMVCGTGRQGTRMSEDMAKRGVGEEVALSACSPPDTDGGPSVASQMSPWRLGETRSVQGRTITYPDGASTERHRCEEEDDALLLGVAALTPLVHQDHCSSTGKGEQPRPFSPTSLTIRVHHWHPLIGPSGGSPAVRAPRQARPYEKATLSPSYDCLILIISTKALRDFCQVELAPQRRTTSAHDTCRCKSRPLREPLPSPSAFRRLQHPVYRGH